MNLWDGLGTALVAALVAFVTARITVWLDKRAVAKTADARWSPALLPAIPNLPMRGAVLVNTGDKEALQVTVEATGGGAFELDPGCRLDRVRPGESIRFVWTQQGNGVVKIQWTTHLGKRVEPLDLLVI